MTFDSLLLLVLFVVYTAIACHIYILHMKCNKGFEQILKKLNKLEEKLKQIK